MHALTTAEWGVHSENLVQTMRRQSYKRHDAVARKSAFLHKSVPISPNRFARVRTDVSVLPCSIMISCGPTAYIAEKRGNLQQAIDAFAAHR